MLGAAGEVLIIDVLQGTSTHKHTSFGWPTTLCRLENLQRAMANRHWERERERERENEREKEREIIFGCCFQENGEKCPYSFWFVGCCFQDLLKTAWTILVLFLLSVLVIVSFESKWCIHTVGLTPATTWKSFRIILSSRSDFPMVNNISIAVHTLPKMRYCYLVYELV